MPVYEYFCRTCHTKYEKLRPLRDADAPIACPSCEEQNSVRVLSVFITHTGNSELRASSQPVHHAGGCCGGACGCGSRN